MRGKGRPIEKVVFGMGQKGVDVAWVAKREAEGG